MPDGQEACSCARHDKLDIARANAGVSLSLSSGVPVVLFPEGTTTDGSRVLRFHSTMLQPAIDAGVPITPVQLFGTNWKTEMRDRKSAGGAT